MYLHFMFTIKMWKIFDELPVATTAKPQNIIFNLIKFGKLSFGFLFVLTKYDYCRSIVF